jgi:hypothetical protein
MSEAPPLTDRELNAAFREGASDEDIEAVLRDLAFWSYVMRDHRAKAAGLYEDRLRLIASISDAELTKAIEALFDEETRESACLTKSTPQAKKGSESNGSLPDDDCTAYS